MTVPVIGESMFESSMKLFKLLTHIMQPWLIDVLLIIDILYIVVMIAYNRIHKLNSVPSGVLISRQRFKLRQYAKDFAACHTSISTKLSTHLTSMIVEASREMNSNESSRAEVSLCLRKKQIKL